MPEPAPLRIAMLTYRGNPRSGGQGVYVRQLSRALVRLGHDVEVISGQPYPELDPGVKLTEVPGLDLYRPDNPLRHRFPQPSELRDSIDEMEYDMMFNGHYPEPLTFSLRARRVLQARVGEFDVVHDNQSLGTGIQGMRDDGHPVLATIHHPLAIDLELSRQDRPDRSEIAERWYDFMEMQGEVARALPLVLTVSETARRDIVANVGVLAERMRVTPLGVDVGIFHPRDGVKPVPGRVFTMAAANVPLKGLRFLLEAMVLVRRQVPGAHLVVVSSGWDESDIPQRVADLGLAGAVTRLSDLSDEQVGEEYARAEVAVVPSLYEGFSLPAVQAMAAGVALVATRAGALPEVVGEDRDTALLVDPGNEAALEEAITALLTDGPLRQRVRDNGRRWVHGRYSWNDCAQRTVAAYRELQP
ncbi:MAG TPA: glycosyltransferase family 4 protein [Candidatus Dormibacteraeota bacterium]|jgi:glycosyltransferase involved in cell wall biosynthesis